MSSVLQTNTSGAVRTLRLDRPDKRNALNADLVSALTDELEALKEADEIRAVVITGSGSAFSAGADLSSLRAMQDASLLENKRDSRALSTLFRMIYRHPKPVIARVNGHAIGGGCGLAAVCDFSIVSDEATLGFSEVRIGFVPAIVMVFVRRKLGDTAARDLLLRGRLLSAEEAGEIGLVTRVVSPDDLDAAVDALAEELATETSGSAVALTKRMLGHLPGMGLDEALEYAVQMNAFARGTDDCRAGIEAFLSDVDPPWKRERRDET